MPTDPEDAPAPVPPPAVPPPSAPEPVARRNFLHGLSRDAIASAAQAVGMVAGAQRVTSEAIGAALGIRPEEPEDGTVAAGAAGSAPDAVTTLAIEGPVAAGAAPRPYRVDGETIRVLDLHRWPDETAEVACTTAAELATAMRARQATGGSVLGELAAHALWLAVIAARGQPAATRRTRIRTTGAALRAARPNVAAIDVATRWMVEAWDLAEAAGADDATLEDACRAAAAALGAHLAADRAASARHAASWLAGRAEATGPVRLLTLGGGGIPGPAADDGGAAGTAAALLANGRAVEVTILETATDPGAARQAAWSLAIAGIPTTVAADAAAGALLAAGAVDAVVVGADRVAGQGTLVATAGTYPVAALAARHGVPVVVVTTSSAVDADPDAQPPVVHAERAPVVDPQRPATVARSTRPGSRGPLQDITPAGLVSAIVTEAGVTEPPSPA